jgi:hypothetical protein
MARFVGLEIRPFSGCLELGASGPGSGLENVSRTIVFSKDRLQDYPKNALRTDLF